MAIKKVIEYAHYLLEQTLTCQDTAVDMTCGNGHDTVLLCEKAKKVYAFDIQEAAINKTKEKTKEFNNVVVIQDSHENILKYVSEAKGVIFNLGYLPGGDKMITTQYATTIKALENVLSLLQVDGICVIVVYPGHGPGMLEAIELEKYVKELNQKEFDCLKYQFINQINYPPYLLAIRRIK